MGFLRLGCSFIASLFMTAVFTIIGGILGTIIYSLVARHSTTEHYLSSPGIYIGGGIGLLIGLSVMMAVMKRTADVNWLKSKGTRIIAIVVDVEKKMGSRQVPVGPNGQIQVQTFHYYVIVTQWIDPRTQRMYTFRSKNLNRYPRKFSKGSSISVLIDQNNPSRYLVEV